MSVSDWSALAVAVLTFFAVLVAVFTFYRSLGSKANLEMSVGDELILHYGGDSGLILTTTFVFINKGSTPGIVTQLTAHLSAVDADSQEPPRYLAWRFFEESTTSSDPATGRTIRSTRSAGPVYALIVPGRAAGSSGNVSSIRLYQEHGLPAGPGGRATFEPLPARGADYLVNFSMQAGPNSRKPGDYACQLRISDGHAEKMQAVCTEVGGVWKRRLIFRRKPVFGTAGQGAENAGGTFESREFRGGY